MSRLSRGLSISFSWLRFVWGFDFCLRLCYEGVFGWFLRVFDWICVILWVDLVGIVGICLLSEMLKCGEETSSYLKLKAFSLLGLDLVCVLSCVLAIVENLSYEGLVSLLL